MDPKRVVIAEMSIGDLIDTLTDIADEHGRDTPLVFAREDFWGGQPKRIYFRAESHDGEIEQLLEESFDED